MAEGCRESRIRVIVSNAVELQMEVFDLDRHADLLGRLKCGSRSLEGVEIDFKQ